MHSRILQKLAAANSHIILLLVCAVFDMQLHNTKSSQRVVNLRHARINTSVNCNWTQIKLSLHRVVLILKYHGSQNAVLHAQICRPCMKSDPI